MTDRLIGLFFLLVAVIYAVAAIQIKAGFTSDVLGPRPYPLLLAALLITLCLVKVVAPRPDGVGPRIPRESLPRLAAAVASFVVYALLLEPLGFLVATMAETIVLCLLFGASLRQAAVAGASISVALYGLFDLLLDLHLPSGTIFGG